MEKSDILIAKEQLEHHPIVIAIVKDGKILFTSTNRGIQPFFDALADRPRKAFAGCSIADRVVGKAALMLAAYLGASCVYSPLASAHAVACARTLENELVFNTDHIVPFIINRTQDGMCPMEEAVLDIDDPEKAYNVLKLTLQKLNNM